MASARDGIINGVGENSVEYIIDTTPPQTNIVTHSGAIITPSGAIISSGNITTTIQIFDNIGIHAGDITTGGTTALLGTHSCTQNSSMQITCSFDIQSSGDLQLAIKDIAGNFVNFQLT